MRVLVFEEHSSSLVNWWRERTYPRTVIYLDAHLDLQYVNKDRLSRLEACTSAEQVEALAKPHHLCPDRHFSYSLENFLYPAAKLGLIDRLVWVAPPHVRTGYSAENFDRLCQTDGVRPEELAMCKKGAGEWIEGRMLGLDVTICDYRQLGQIPLPADGLIDIDIDYFVAVPGDEPWINPRAVFDALLALPVTPPFVTVARSVDSGFTPLRYRFFADYLAALWEGRHGDSEHYDRLYHLDRRLRAGEREAVLADCRQEAERYPECAATSHLLSLAEPDAGQAAAWQARAAAFSSAYGPNLLRSACEIRSRRLSVNLDEVILLHKRADDASLGSQQRGLAEVEFGLIYSAFGRLERATDCYRRATGPGREHPELALEIAKLLVNTGQANSAIALLHTALQDDKTRTVAHLFLAQIDAARGLLEQSRQHLDQAIEAAPAWRQLIDLLASVHQQLGNAEQAQALRERSEQQRRQAEALARQLS